MKVNNLLIIVYFIIIGIGLLKKLAKNKVILDLEFYDCYINYNNNPIIKLKEEEQNEKIINKINEEMNYVNYLIKSINKEILFNIDNQKIIKNNNNRNIICIPHKELLSLKKDISKTCGFIAAKNEDRLKIEMVK